MVWWWYAGLSRWRCPSVGSLGRRVNLIVGEICVVYRRVFGLGVGAGAASAVTQFQSAEERVVSVL